GGNAEPIYRSAFGGRASYTLSAPFERYLVTVPHPRRNGRLD
ncbi:hypothetical protein LCGC14_2833070, partial [marine sediment metagenome]